ncbi:hypothetical protein GCM10009798_23420 [Nocardioides panacihumi]|uniref:TadE-like domain-containing protein n=1 Tax=Nocardioides panacihumi TaxID=400774 RepID=A0ABN2R425_9ACTN
MPERALSPTLSDVAGSEKRSVRRRTDHGAAAVEFALLLVPLLIIVFGIIQYGFYFWTMQGGADIARDAARRAAVGDPVVCTDFKSYVTGKINGFVGSGKVVTISRRYVQNPLIPVASRNSATEIRVNDTVNVAVKFKGYDFHLPFVPFPKDGMVTASAEARVESVDTQPGALTCT